MVTSRVKFSMGRLITTCGVADKMEQDGGFRAFVSKSLGRHAEGDWGDVCANDKAANNKALKINERVLSAYEIPGLPKIWIITERDRSVTTVLFPEEY